MQQDQVPAVPETDDVGAKAKRGNPVTGFLDKYWRTRDNEAKLGPIPRTMLAIGLVVGGFLLGEALQWGKNLLMGPDEFLVEIKNEQKTAFERLQEKMDDLTRSIGSGNRDAVAQVKDAVDEIKHLNDSLIARLSHANAENARLSKAVGVPGGLDMILTPNTGMPLDDQSEVGVLGITSTTAYVAVSTKEGDVRRRPLRAGQSVEYTNAAGRSCRVIMRSIEPRRSVLLANRCA